MIGIKPILGGGKRLAVSDIHGCALTFEMLLNTINLQKEDNLFILGDIINRGKRSKKLVKKIILLQKEGYLIFPLRGNHEQYVISEMQKKSLEKFFIICEKLNLEWLFKSQKKIVEEEYSKFFYAICKFLRLTSLLKPKELLILKSKYTEFFLNLPYYYDLGDILLSHAGFDLSQNNMFDNLYAMINQREFTNIDKIPNSVKIVHGHSPISLQKIKNAITSNSPTINIDNGCVYKSKDMNKGNLVCLDLDSFEIVVQKNID